MSGAIRTYHLASEAQTRAFGDALATILRSDDVIGLIGPLGAGKSVLARGIVCGLMTRGHPPSDGDRGDPFMPSPTFTLVETYPTPVGQVSHFDLYRLGEDQHQISARDARDIGLEEAMTVGPVIIEWADRALDLLPANAVLIRLAPVGWPLPDKRGQDRVARAALFDVAPTDARDSDERRVTIAAQADFIARLQNAPLSSYRRRADGP